MIQLSTARIVRMYAAGASCRAIAKEVGCSEMTIITRLHREGVAMRPSGRRAREIQA